MTLRNGTMPLEPCRSYCTSISTLFSLGSNITVSKMFFPTSAVAETITYVSICTLPVCTARL